MPAILVRASLLFLSGLHLMETIVFAASFLIRPQHDNEAAESGFTLVEIIVVMVMIALLVSIVAPKMFPKLGQGKQTAAKAQIELLGQALDHLRLDVGRYPTTEENLRALVKNPGIAKWAGSYLKKDVPRDPWDREYRYESPGTHGEYDLFSYGRDGTPGGEGEDKDIVSWE